MAENSYRGQEGDEPYGGVYLRKRDSEKERIADYAQERERRESVPEA